MRLPWAYQRVFHGEPDEAEPELPRTAPQGGCGAAAVHRPDRVHRCVPQADARPHRAEREAAHHPRERAHRLRRARHPGRPPRRHSRGHRALQTSTSPEVAWFALSPMLVLPGWWARAVGARRAPTPRAAVWSVRRIQCLHGRRVLVLTFVLWDDITDKGATTLVAVLAFDGFAMLATIIVCVAILLASLVSDDYLRRGHGRSRAVRALPHGRHRCHRHGQRQLRSCCSSVSRCCRWRCT